MPEKLQILELQNVQQDFPFQNIQNWSQFSLTWPTAL